MVVERQIGMYDVNGPGRGMAPETVEMFFLLEDDKLYTPTMVVTNAGYKKKDDPVLFKKMFERVNSFLRNNGLNLEPNGSVKGRKAWLGSTLRDRLTDKSYQIGVASLKRKKEEKEVADNESETLVAQELFTQEAELGDEVFNGSSSGLSLVAPHQEAIPTGVPESGVPAFAGMPSWRGLTGLRRMPKAWTAFVFCILFAITLWASTGWRPSVFTVLTQEGIRSAAAYIAGQHPRNDHERYQWAFIDYRNNNLDGAEKSIYALMSQDISSKLRGDCHYLLGGIRLQTGALTQALGELHEAEVLYQQERKPANLYHVALGMAQVYIDLNDKEQAQDALDDAISYIHWDASEEQLLPHKGAYHMIASKYYKRFELYAEGLAHAKKASAIYKDGDDTDNLANAYANLGYLYAATGDANMGLRYTRRAHDLIFELGDERRLVYNLENFILIDRCLGYKPDPLAIKQIKEWSLANKDQELMNRLNRALTLEIPRSTNHDHEEASD